MHSPDPVVLPHSDYVLRLMQRLRDEAHRFAITYFRKKHEARNLASVLDGIKGVGKKRKAMLLSKFGSAENVAHASLEDLTEIDGFGESYARKVYEFFRNR